MHEDAHLDEEMEIRLSGGLAAQEDYDDWEECRTEPTCGECGLRFTACDCPEEEA